MAESSKPPSDRRYQIELSKQAETAYTKAYLDAEASIKAGKPTGARVKRFRGIEEAVKKIIPQDPFALNRSLSGKLAGIYRVKKGRIRICYVGSSTTRKIGILYISETRKEGDKNDPYVLLTKMIQSGRFAEFLEELGVGRPR